MVVLGGGGDEAADRAGLEFPLVQYEWMYMFVVNLLTLLQLDAFSTPQLKKDLDKMRTDWLNTKLQMGWFHFVIIVKFMVRLG